MKKSETYRNEIKSYIVRTGMTMTEVVDFGHGHAGADNVGFDLVAIGFGFSHIQTFLLFFQCALW